MNLLLQSFKQLYISNKMEHFSYKGTCGIHWRMHIKIKEQLAWAADKRLQITSNMLFKTVILIRN